MTASGPSSSGAGRRGEPRAQAWREPQLALLRSDEFAHPYYWAAFTLTGQWREASGNLDHNNQKEPDPVLR